MKSAQDGVLDFEFVELIKKHSSPLQKGSSPKPNPKHSSERLERGKRRFREPISLHRKGKPMNIREKDDRKFGFNDLVSYICDILSYN